MLAREQYAEAAIGVELDERVMGVEGRQDVVVAEFEQRRAPSADRGDAHLLQRDEIGRLIREGSDLSGHAADPARNVPAEDDAHRAARTRSASASSSRPRGSSSAGP